MKEFDTTHKDSFDDKELEKVTFIGGYDQEPPFSYRMDNVSLA